jgi:hypothetical protein
MTQWPKRGFRRCRNFREPQSCLTERIIERLTKVDQELAKVLIALGLVGLSGPPRQGDDADL